MKRTYILIASLLLFSISKTCFSQLIPTPVHITLQQGNFQLNEKTIILTDNSSESDRIAQWLKRFISAATGFNLPVSNKTSGNNNIAIKLLKTKDKAIGQEGYKLKVAANGIDIAANGEAGLFYAIQTMIQLLPKEIESKTRQGETEWKISATEILDYPRFSWRGLMLDVTRHFFTADEIKQFIDEMVRFKFNILHLHLSDDQGWRIEIKSLPELTQKGAWRVQRAGSWRDRTAPEEGEPATYGGFYTQQQMKDIIRYAMERNVQILPEIDVPGHSLAAIASYNNLSCTKLLYNVNAINPLTTENNALCAGQEATYEFLEKVFAEIAALFPFKYIHIGGDECNRSFWAKCAACRKTMKDKHLKTGAELQSYFTRRLEKILQRNGKDLLGWDEILEGGLAPGATVMSWRGMTGGIAAAKLNHKVVMAPVNYTYLNLPQDDPLYEGNTDDKLKLKTCYEFEPVPAGVDARFILGGQGNLWSEVIPHLREVQYLTWPRALALAEVFWSPKNKRNWKDFIRRTERYSKRLDVSGIKYSPAFYDATIMPSLSDSGILTLKLNTDLDGLEVYYTFDNTAPDLYSDKYVPGQTLLVPRDADAFKMISYKNEKPLGRLLTVSLDELKEKLVKGKVKFN